MCIISNNSHYENLDALVRCLHILIILSFLSVNQLLKRGET